MHLQTILDVNHDGKVDMKDVKAAFAKVGDCTRSTFLTTTTNKALTYYAVQGNSLLGDAIGWRVLCWLGSGSEGVMHLTLHSMLSL